MFYITVNFFLHKNYVYGYSVFDKNKMSLYN